MAISDMGGLSLMGNIAALFSMLTAASALSITAFIAFRTRDDVKTLESLKLKLENLEREIEEELYVSDEIANLLYDLFSLWSASNARVELVSLGIDADPALSADIKSCVMLIEKHFAELGLFSRDQVRRKSVQMALSTMYGDLKTLEIMRRIIAGEMGKSDEGVKLAFSSLRARLMKSGIYVTDSQSWTGRPSGGAF